MKPRQHTHHLTDPRGMKGKEGYGSFQQEGSNPAIELERGSPYRDGVFAIPMPIPLPLPIPIPLPKRPFLRSQQSSSSSSSPPPYHVPPEEPPGPSSLVGLVADMVRERDVCLVAGVDASRCVLDLPV
ncbi:hypothetical protein CRUP_005857 [Coryphaenoides rupestris]|nr:hypothetical protein CRUP_005857 [Coryphaenoides rupestris]